MNAGGPDRSRWRVTRWPVALIVAVAAAILTWVAVPYVSSAALLMDMTGTAPRVRRFLPVRVAAVDTRDLSVPTRHGEIAARLYRSAGASGPAVIIFPGVHGGGVDEPRLVALSRRIAATGVSVLSTPLPDLRRYRVTTRATDMIEDATGWMAANRELAPQGKVGVVAVSFAGGLALVAAGRPSLDDKITAVFALGAHADLPRVIRYLCLAEGAVKTLAPPHDYGVALMLLASISLVVPADQVAALDTAIVTFLDASSADSTDRALSARLFAEARSMEAALPEPARTLMHGINTRDVPTLGKVLAPFAEEIGGAAALSPARSRATTAPVFLLHGVDDNVIPSAESIEIEKHLRAGGNTRVETLLTPLVSHAESKVAGTRDMWRLISFWTRMAASFERAR